MIKRNLPCMRLRAAICAAAILSMVCLPAHGQYFGQNKVRYDAFDFQVLKTDHFDIYYYPREQKIVERVGRMAERWHFRISSVLGFKLSGRQRLIIYADHPDFQQTAIIPGLIGETTGGVTESIRRRIVMPLAGSLGETDHVLGHELVHAFQYDLSSRANRAGIGVSLQGLPLWFVEGMAEYLSVGPDDPFTTMWIRDAVIHEQIPDIRKLDDPKYFPYRWGQAVWAYIAGNYGDAVLGRILKAAARDGDAEGAISSTLGVSMDALSEQWHQALKKELEPVQRLTGSVDGVGEVIVSRQRSNSGLNVSPAISPDGKYAMLFSEKSLFAVNLYMADARTGKFLRKITETAISPHFVNLQFSNAAGSWSPDGKRFAFARVKGSTPGLSVYDVERNTVAEDIPVREVGEIFSVSWSPDGKTIAFDAVVGGVSDLYAMDLDSKKVNRLTNDEYADLQPSWAPDGTKIAFVTDRFTTDLTGLFYGQYRLALLDLKTGGITGLPGFDKGKHINPVWSPDGSSLLFISDRGGISNIYRLSLDGGTTSQVTNINTGVSGITRLSPAVSIAGDGSLLFSVFAGGDYQIHRMDYKKSLEGLPEEPDRAGAGILPPRQRDAGELTALLKDPNRGLTGSGGFKSEKYSPRLQLDYVSPASIAVGTSRYGTLVGGGMAIHFSDFLNYHELGFELQTTTINLDHPLRNLSGIATYLNKRSRWTWGFSGGQASYLSAGFDQSLGQINGQPVIVQSDTTFWQIERGVVGLLQYPFNRARRVEFSSGYQNLDFAASSDISIYDPFSGALIGQDSTDLPAPDSLHMSTSSVAFVNETSIFGGISPVVGERYRFEGGINAGSLFFTTALADYRRYFHIARPLSVAGRLLHYGRYGADAEDNRIQPLYLGFSSLVRGYEADSISAAECGPQLVQTGACPIVDRLVGSRIGVANAELRLQLVGPLGIIPSRGIPPVEIAPFFDAGVAWTSAAAPDFFGGSRRGISSYGASVRFNIMGFLVGQLSAVHPNDRPLKGWFLEFSFLPGF